MTKGGILIRLIDVAMIILFGFIAISDIKVRAQIKLPSEEQEQKQDQEEKDPELLFVKITADNQLVVEYQQNPMLVTSEPGALEAFLTQQLRSFQTQGKDMVVLIEPNEDSMIQQTIDIMDICERNQIPKNINYESMQF